MAYNLFWETVRLPVPGGAVQGRLFVPDAALGVVALIWPGAMPDGVRARLAEELVSSSVAVLSCTLRTVEQARVDELEGAAPSVLVPRIAAVHRWIRRQDMLSSLAVGYFAMGAPAVAAWLVAQHRPPRLSAMALASAQVSGLPPPPPGLPLMLVVADKDPLSLFEDNRRTVAVGGGEYELHIIPDAAPGYETPEASRYLGRLASRWFERQFSRALESTAGWTV